jgi:acyl dehydratase
VRGLYFKKFEIGAVYRHASTRTVTEFDNVLYTSMTLNVQPLHPDEEFASKTVHGQRVVNSMFTLGLVAAFQVPELTLGTTLDNLGYEKGQLPAAGLRWRGLDTGRLVSRGVRGGPTGVL